MPSFLNHSLIKNRAYYIFAKPTNTFFSLHLTMHRDDIAMQHLLIFAMAIILYSSEPALFEADWVKYHSVLEGGIYVVKGSLGQQKMC